MTRIRVMAAIGTMALVAAACGSSPAATTTTAGTSSGTTAAPTGTTAAPSTTAATGGGGGTGSATLTVGDMTFTFDGYYCAFGADTGNSRVSFSSGAFARVDGHNAQLDVSIQDTNESGAMSGEGTLQSITLNDVEDFENPVVGYEAVSGFVGAPSFTIMVDGNHVTAEAAFDDTTTDDIESIPGTFDASCPG